MLPGESELGDTGGAARQPGEGAGAARTGVPATKPAVVDVSSAGKSSSGAASAGVSPGVPSGARAGVTNQRSSQTTAALCKDDQDLLGLTIKIHPPEVSPGANPGVASGARPGITNQKSSPTTAALSKDDQDLLGLTTKIHASG